MPEHWLLRCIRLWHRNRLGDIANDWRVNILDLEPITAISSASISSVVSVADAATRK